MSDTQRLLRAGIIPMLCGSASCCFALYGAKVAAAAAQWRQLQLPLETDRVLCSLHALELERHGGGCATLSFISAVAAAEAARDYMLYRAASKEGIGAVLFSRLPFFARPTVLATGCLAGLASHAIFGGVMFVAPKRPILRTVGVR